MRGGAIPISSASAAAAAGIIPAVAVDALRSVGKQSGATPAIVIESSLRGDSTKVDPPEPVVIESARVVVDSTDLEPVRSRAGIVALPLPAASMMTPAALPAPPLAAPRATPGADEVPRRRIAVIVDDNDELTEGDEIQELDTHDLEDDGRDDDRDDDVPEAEAAPRTTTQTGGQRSVPVGEFEHGGTRQDSDKLRQIHSQSTIKRDAASSLLQIPEPSETVVRPPPVQVLLTESAEHIRSDATGLEPGTPSTTRFERGDPTTNDQGVTASLGAPSISGTLRNAATLRRKRGIGGDMRYVFTVLFGVRRARQEHAELEVSQASRQAERRRHLVTLGRTAVITELDHPALAKSREQLGDVEDERAQHAGQVAAADQELTRVRRDREAKIKQHQLDVAAVEAELHDLGRKQEPLDRDAAQIKKRAAGLRESLQRIDGQLAAAEASKTSIKGQKLDPAAIAAELATLRADRKAVQRDEPAIAAELDALQPRIAAIEAARGDARARRTRLDADEQADQHRVAELLEAIGAKRKVVDRAAGDAETLRDKILFDLGEALYVDRPRSLTAQLAAVDAIDVELGTQERRMMELKEILSNVDRAKLFRGLAVLVLILGGVAAIGLWFLYLSG